MTDQRPPEPGFAGKTLVIVPTYNERQNVERLIDAILGLGAAFDILIVDDSSPDGTGELANVIAELHPGRVTVLHRHEKSGIGPAYISGFRAALASPYQQVATMDADFSHDPRDLLRLTGAAESADVVLGSRYVDGGSVEGWPVMRRLLSRVGGAYARHVLGVPIADLTGGFKVFSRKALEALPLDRLRSDGYVFQIETTYRLWEQGLTVKEVPIRFVDRVAGKSKLSRRIVLEAIVVVWLLRLRRLLD